MREGDALPQPRPHSKRTSAAVAGSGGPGRGAGGRGAAVRCAVAPRCESDPVGEWQENTSRVAALHITHKRQKQLVKKHATRGGLAAPLSPRPRTGLS